MSHSDLNSDRLGKWLLVVFWTFGLFMMTVWQSVAIAPGDIERVSVSSSGGEANANNFSAEISGDGRYVVFSSAADNLAPGDSTGTEIFVHDRQLHTTTLVSVNSNGVGGNQDSLGEGMSDDGRFIVFFSQATNLVADDTNGSHDIFVHDQQTGETTRVSLNGDGVEGNGTSWYPSISGNGRFISFYSEANNLIAGDTNGIGDIFVHDRQTGEASRVSVSSNGAAGNGGTGYFSVISGNGRYVVFSSDANNLVSQDLNGKSDVFVHDRQTGLTTRLSVNANGAEGNGHSGGAAISDNGRYIAFTSWANNLVEGDTNGLGDVFLYDQQTAELIRVSVGQGNVEANGDSEPPAISADGRFVVFGSYANNLVPNDTNEAADIFAFDRQTRVLTRVSVTQAGVQGNGDSGGSVSVSTTGSFIAFNSFANNLVSGDANEAYDIFVKELALLTYDFSLYLPIMQRK